VKAKEIKADRVILSDGRELPTGNAIWTAGARASEKRDDLDLPSGREERPEGGRAHARRGHKNVWSVGDCGATIEEDGRFVRPNAQAAVQEGRAVARNVLAAMTARRPNLSTTG
jgi:NADH:ubiquinone reductase (H+-translocating)